MADQPVMSCEQVLLVHFQGNADVDSGRSSQYIYIYIYIYTLYYTKIPLLLKLVFSSPYIYVQLCQFNCLEIDLYITIRVKLLNLNIAA